MFPALYKHCFGIFILLLYVWTSWAHIWQVWFSSLENRVLHQNGHIVSISIINYSATHQDDRWPTRVNWTTKEGERHLRNPTSWSSRITRAVMDLNMTLILKRLGFQAWNQRGSNLPNSPPQLSNHSIGMQKLQKEWEMSFHPLVCYGPHVSTKWKHISATDPQLHSLSHSPYFPHPSL
jgi:hypothetical protein